MLRILAVAVSSLALGCAASAATPPFAMRVERVTAGDLRYSWRAGCPVSPSELRRVRLAYWGFDGRRRVGVMIVHQEVTGAVAGVFRRLYAARFPIRRIQPIDVYRGSDDASMAADNTSAFNCRSAVAPGPRRWSAHAYGRAIDVNPVENPYLLDGRVLPPTARAHIDRSLYRRGMAVPGGMLVQAFAAAGWGWGGSWSSPDYQHFSATGR